MESYYRQVFREKILDAVHRPLPELTPREVFVPRVQGKVFAVTGMRRAGKTTFLWQQLRALAAAGWSREALVYISFEDERLPGLTAGHLTLFLEEYYVLFPEQQQYGSKTCFFLDEIQLVSGWESFVRRLLDSGLAEVWISGSSSKMLSTEIASALRGRGIAIPIYPFRFREILTHRKMKVIPYERLSAQEISQQTRLFETYLLEGGFPEAQQLDERSRVTLLRSYLDTVIVRDMLERHNIGQPVVLRWMVNQLLANPAGSFSIQKFFQDVKSQGHKLTKDLLYEFLAHIEDTFLIQTCALYTLSERRRRVNLRKAYPVDPAFVSLFTRVAAETEGHRLEAAVSIELLRSGVPITYGKSTAGYEVDFVIERTGEPVQLLQVCANLDHPQTLARELRALQEAQVAFPGANKVLLTLHQQRQIVVPPDVRVISALQWFLESPV